MRPRLEILWNLLSETGSIWISIDDDERDYLKVLCDSVFGRQHFLTSIVWQKRYSRENREAIGDSHEYILLYVKDKEIFKQERNYLPLTEKQRKAYKNPDNAPRGPWQSVSLLAQGFRQNQMYTIISPNGKEHKPPTGNCIGKDYCMMKVWYVFGRINMDLKKRRTISQLLFHQS